MPTPKTKVVQDEDGEPIAVEIIADAIVAISDAMKRIDRTRLTRRTIVTLILDHTSGLRRTDVDTVLNAMEQLERNCLKPKPPTPARKK
jgi:hypothetical protein